jgi:acyl-CoA reductase-like NAD-dependent aldehyde dehydrogenase
MAGNAVVGKVSEHASWSSSKWVCLRLKLGRVPRKMLICCSAFFYLKVYYGSIVQEALKACGHSPDLVQTVTGMAEAGQALVSDPLVDKVIFTGSTPIGRKVMAAAASTLTPVILELGGKDAMVLMDDVNVDSAVPWVMRGCFQNSGQNCVGVERVVVYESVHDEFIDKIVPKVKALRQGIPLETCGADGKVDCGSMIMPQQLDIVQALVDDAVKKGAILHCGGKRNPKLDGQFYEPTLLR